MANAQLAKNLLFLRESNGWKQTDVAELLSISRQGYANYETGERNPDVDTLFLLAKIYKVSIDQLITAPIKEKDIHTQDFLRILNEKRSMTLYMSEEEIKIIMDVRELDKDGMRLLKVFLAGQKKTRKG